MNSQKYFGVPLTNINAAKSREFVGKHRLNVNVPSRQEVATLPADELRRVLVAWMNHSITEIIPSRAQIYEVLEVLRVREDFNELNDISEMCANYILGD